MDISDLQATVTAGSCSSRVIFNVPKARSRGVEVEFAAAPNEQLRLLDLRAASTTPSCARPSPRPTSGDVSIVSGIEEGNRLPTVPEFQIAAAATYQWQMRAGALGYVTGTFQHIGLALHADRRPGRGLRHGEPELVRANTIGGPLTASTFTFDPELPSYDIAEPARSACCAGQWDVALFAQQPDRRARAAGPRPGARHAGARRLPDQPAADVRPHRPRQLLGRRSATPSSRSSRRNCRCDRLLVVGHPGGRRFVRRTRHALPRVARVPAPRFPRRRPRLHAARDGGAERPPRIPEPPGRLEPAAWPVAQQVDYRLVRAEMNGLDFDHRVLRPWARDPCFYSRSFTARSDTPDAGRPVPRRRDRAWRLHVPAAAADAEPRSAPGSARSPAPGPGARQPRRGRARPLARRRPRAAEQAATLADLATRRAHHPELVADVERARSRRGRVPRMAGSEAARQDAARRASAWRTTTGT